MNQKYVLKRNVRIFLFQYLLSNLFVETSFEQLKNVFWFDEEKIDEEQILKYIKIYENKKDYINGLLNKDIYNKSDNSTIAIIKLGILLFIGGEKKKLVISECLKISDIFLVNSMFVNAFLEQVFPSINH